MYVNVAVPSSAIDIPFSNPPLSLFSNSGFFSLRAALRAAFSSGVKLVTFFTPCLASNLFGSYFWFSGVSSTSGRAIVSILTWSTPPEFICIPAPNSVYCVLTGSFTS